MQSLTPFFDFVLAMVAAGSLAVVFGTMLYLARRSSRS
jgi:hypothetical protein